MVATRRMAQHGPDDQSEAEPNPSLTLKKKPVRKGAAQPQKPEPKARATRNAKKTGEDAAAVENPRKLKISDRAVDTPAPQEEGEPVKEPAKKTAGRPRKAKEPTPTVASRRNATASESTSSGRSSKTRKAAAPVEEAPDLQATEQEKTTRTRGALVDRAPLSPKKVTQVMNPSPRKTRGTAQKSTAKPSKKPTETKGASKKQQVSDENADVRDMAGDQSEHQEGKTVGRRSHRIAPDATPQPKRKAEKAKPSTRTRSKRTPKTEQLENTEANDEMPETEQGEKSSLELDSAVDHYSDAVEQVDQDDEQESNASEDELCGPKTPMKRSSTEDEARYHASAQRTIRKIQNMGTDTPARRYAIDRPTPQTQRPYHRTSHPTSAVRPMTVARGMNRAFVFRDLRERAPTLEDPVECSSIVEDDTFVFDDEIIPGVEAHIASLQHVTPPPVTANMEVEQKIDSQCDQDEWTTEGHEIADEDPDETILVPDHDEEQAKPASQPSEEGTDREDTVVIHEHSECSSPAPAPAPAAPETLVWGNVHKDDTITVNFDLHMADARPSPRRDVIQQTAEVLETGPSLEQSVSEEFEQDVASASEEHFQQGEDPALWDQDDNDAELDQNQGNPAMNLNEFVDLAGLSEPTQRLDLLAQDTSKTAETEAEDDQRMIEVDMNLEMEDKACPAENEERPSEHTDVIDAPAANEKQQAVDLTTLPCDDGNTTGLDLSRQTTGDTSDNEAAGENTSDAHEPSNHGPETSLLLPALATELTAQEQMLMSADIGDVEGTQQPPGEAEEAFLEEEEEEEQDVDVPHYALPTRSFDARRKSMPSFPRYTPVKAGARPTTSDGASMPRVPRPFIDAFWTSSSKEDATTTPSRAGSAKRRRSTVASQAETPRISTPSKHPATASSRTPVERFPRRVPRLDYAGHAMTVAAPKRFKKVNEAGANRRQTFHRAISGATQSPKPQPEASMDACLSQDMFDASSTPHVSSQERFPRRSARKNYTSPSGAASSANVTPKERFPLRSANQGDLGGPQTMAAKRFSNRVNELTKRRDTFHRAMPGQKKVDEDAAQTPEKTSRSVAVTLEAVPKESFPHLPAQEAYEESSASTPEAAAPQEPSLNVPAQQQERFPRLPAQDAYEDNTKSVPEAATPKERFPRLPAQSDYSPHASTVAAPPRFRTPTKSPLKRVAATAQKPKSLRKAALIASTPQTTKTPLKAPAETPGQAPMTPHPAAPLRGVLALVEVFTLEGASASSPFVALLHRLGAKTTRVWSERITHVVFKDGSPTTLQKVRVHNKGIREQGKPGSVMHCVNSRWVADCEADGMRVDEDDEVYVVDLAEVPRGGRRRRKSMEPSALVNMGGNVMKGRKSSLGRSSLGRSPVKFDTPAFQVADVEAETPESSFAAGKENFADEDDEPLTPEWIAAPDRLVQQTAPMDRVRKLELKGGHEGGGKRRLTFWNGHD